MQYLEVTKDTHQNALDKINKHAKNGGESVIALTAPWCGHCNALKPELAKMKPKLKGGNGIVANVSDKYHSQLKMDTTVDGFPTIRHFKGGNKVKDYEGKRVATDLANFANSSLNTTMIGGRRKKTRKRHRKKHKKTRRRKTKHKRRKRRKKTRKRNIKVNALGVAMYDSKKASGNPKINKGLEYAEKLVGIKYQVSNKAPTEDSCPFWNRDGPPPSIEDIKKGGLACVGVTNLIRRHLGLKIPIESGKWKDVFPGGSGAWFHYLKERLQKINYSKTYPKGTLLLENWNPKNMGHVAIVWTENKKGLSHSKILHGRHDGPKSVVIEPLDNYTMKRRFTHVCLPEDWLVKN